jgi:hypothetical protein
MQDYQATHIPQGYGELSKTASSCHNAELAFFYLKPALFNATYIKRPAQWME